MIGDRWGCSLNYARPVTLMLCRLGTDILFGRQNGLKTLLVMTGVTQQAGLERASQEQTPDYYCQSIADILVCSLT